jgi:hypothetical protein
MRLRKHSGVLRWSHGGLWAEPRTRPDRRSDDHRRTASVVTDDHRSEAHCPELREARIAPEDGAASISVPVTAVTAVTVAVVRVITLTLPAREAHEVATDPFALDAEVASECLGRAVRRAMLDEPPDRGHVPVATRLDQMEVERNAGGKCDDDSVSVVRPA